MKIHISRLEYKCRVLEPPVPGDTHLTTKSVITYPPSGCVIVDWTWVEDAQHWKYLMTFGNSP
jgi:hypothetical protein